MEALVSSATSISWRPVYARSSGDQRAVPQVRSVAEISALLAIPLGVVRVLVADMAGKGLVTVYQPRWTRASRTRACSKGCSVDFAGSSPGLTSTKIVVAGGFGVGKTTFVGAVSEIPPLTTEAVMTDASARARRRLAHPEQVDDHGGDGLRPGLAGP